MLQYRRVASTVPSGSGIVRAGLRALFLLSAVVLRVPSAAASHIDGALPVDGITLPRLAAVADILVKVDKAYPYGDAQDQFKEFCARYVEGADKIRKRFFIATVGVDTYGEKHNQDLADELGAPEEDKWPQYYLIKKGTQDLKKATHHVGSDNSADALASFVKRTVGITLGATGTLEEMDSIAVDFAAAVAGGGDGASLVEKAKAQAAKYDEAGDKSLAEVYLKVMAKVGQKGAGYFKSETDRITRMLDDGKMSADKRKLFQEKISVLGSFTAPGNEEL